MKLWEYVLRRLLLVIPILLGVTLITFTLTQFMGDPAAGYTNDRMSEEQIQEIEEKYNLNDPVHMRYLAYLNGLLHGDLGYSESVNMPVTEAIKLKFSATIELALLALMISVLSALPLGVYAANHHNRLPDHVIRLFALLGSALPIFWLALVFKYYLAYQWDGQPFWDESPFPIGERYDAILWTHTDPIPRPTGYMLIDSIAALSWPHLKDAIVHMILPATTLAYASMAAIIRLLRSSMLESQGQDYVRTARAKGLSARQVTRDHARRNALIPTTTYMGLVFGGLLTGSVLTETIWNWPGLGKWAVLAIRTQDTAAILGFTLLTAMIYIMANLIVDILYAYLDPRVELGGDEN